MTQAIVEAWWGRIGTELPLVCAPMGGVAGGRLAAAVSAAGALGTIGMGSSGAPESLTRELIAYEHAGGAGPFGIGLVDWSVALHPSMLDLAIEARPTLLSVSFGDFSPGSSAPEWIARAEALGIATITQVATADEAVIAMNAGVSAIVARGLESGGHGNPVAELTPLLSEVLESVDRRIPVLAAGAIAHHADLTRVVQAGAAGAWVGTAFAACPESLSSNTNREILLQAGGGDTHITREFDIAAGLPWPEHFPERVIRGTPVNAGMGVGKLTHACPAAEVVASFRQ